MKTLRSFSLIALTALITLSATAGEVVPAATSAVTASRLQKARAATSAFVSNAVKSARTFEYRKTATAALTSKPAKAVAIVAATVAVGVGIYKAAQNQKVKNFFTNLKNRFARK